MNIFNKSQELNKWSEMIGNIYDGTQNYSKSTFEVHCHLTEVTGAFGKMVFKKDGNFDKALQFLPKMFVWALTLFRKVNGANSDLQEALLTKFPRVCSYCLNSPCKCWNGPKPDVQLGKAKDLFRKNYIAQDKSLNGIQLMFRKIYGESWGLDGVASETDKQPIDILRMMYIRLVEELSEVAEAIRFKHLYPSNLDNELADYLAWWFAIVTNFNRLYSDKAPLSAEDLVWNAYPNFCLSCGLRPCDCRPRPVRELLSKPSLNNLAYTDSLTQSENHNSFSELLDDIRSSRYPSVVPIACVRIDVDDFKLFNNEMSHSAGDSALKAIVTELRQKVRNRDRIFRVGGDEFAVVCQDFSSLEAKGMMERFADNLKTRVIKGINSIGVEVEKTITLSIGISTCNNPSDILQSFEQADLAAIESKKNGKDRISIN